MAQAFDNGKVTWTTRRGPMRLDGISGGGHPASPIQNRIGVRPLADDQKHDQPVHTPTRRGNTDARLDREAEALRANLKKRRQQAKARANPSKD